MYSNSTTGVYSGSKRTRTYCVSNVPDLQSGAHPPSEQYSHKYYSLQRQRNYIPIGIVPVGVKALDLNALLEYTLIPILIKEIIFFISFIIWS